MMRMMRQPLAYMAIEPVSSTPNITPLRWQNTCHQELQQDIKDGMFPKAPMTFGQTFCLMNQRT